MAYTPGINGGRINFSMSGINTSGTAALISTGTFQLAGGTNVTLSQSQSTITISAANQTVQTQNVHNVVIGGNTAGATASISSGTMTLAGGNNVTLSQAGNGITVSAGPRLQRWEYPTAGFTSLAIFGQNSLSIQHVYLPFNLTGSEMKIGGSISVASTTGAGAGIRTASFSVSMGIYTLAGSTLGLSTSASALNTITWNGSNASSGWTGAIGMRQFTTPLSVNLPPGEYWAAALISASTAGQSLNFTIYGNNGIANGASSAVLMPLGSNTAQARDAMLFQGIYNTTTNGLPATIQGSQIQNMSAGYVQLANFYHVIYNSTY